MKKIISTFLCVVMLATFIPFFASAEGEGRDVIDSGTCAKNVTWVLYDDGELVFSGTGVVPPCYNVEQGYDRWSKYFSQVKVITIQDGIRGISKEAFATDKGIASASLYKITIPDSVTYIGEDIVDAKLMSAQNGERLSAICFAGSEEKWNSFFSEPGQKYYDGIVGRWEKYFNGEEPKPHCMIKYGRYSNNEYGDQIEEGPFAVGVEYYAEDMDVSFEWNVTGTTEILKEYKDGNGVVTGLELKPFKRGNAYVSVKMFDKDGNVLDSTTQKYTTQKIAPDDDFKTALNKIKAQIEKVINAEISLLFFGFVAAYLGVLYGIVKIKEIVGSWFR